MSETPQDKERAKAKAALKKDADDTHAFAQDLARKIPSQSGGMSIADFKNKFIPGFESGYVGLTPETTDTPYGMPATNRPKIKILSEGN
jgi:hypothetical protein